MCQTKIINPISFLMIFLIALGINKTYAQNSNINFANTYLGINDNINEVISRIDTKFYSIDTTTYNKGQGVLIVRENQTQKAIGSISFEDGKIIQLYKIWGYEVGENALNIFNDLFNILNDKIKNGTVKIELNSLFEPNNSTKSINVRINKFEEVDIEIFNKNIQIAQRFSNGRIHYER